MTTIVYKDRVLAFDSRRTVGSVITTDDANKCVVDRGVSFVLAGSCPDFAQFRSAYFGEQVTKKLDVCGFALDGGVLWRTGFCPNDGFWKCKVDLSVPAAMGSGLEFALGAIDMGANAVTAVKIAKGRDIYSGGRIRTLRVP